MRDPTFDPRVVGQLTRYHSWPRNREQSVGEHTWQILRILLTVWPDCPRKILHYVVFHDAGEMAGDVQYPWKQRVPELGVGMKKAETQVFKEMQKQWGIGPVPVLSEYELAAFKVCEYLEMWEWGLYEEATGNQFGKSVTMRMIQAASGLMAKLEPPPGYPDIRPALQQYVRRRMESEQHAAS